MTVDILFPTFNRLEYTQMAWACLIRNTDWEAVNRVCVYDDASEDGTREWIEAQIGSCPVAASLTFLGHRTPVAAMNHMVGAGDSEWFVKIDSDACVPPGWLGHLLSVLDVEPLADLIGMEAGMTRVAGRDEPWDGVYGFRPASHIGGIGLMRRAAFRRPMQPKGSYHGFTEFQRQSWLIRGWIDPDLPLVLLDRIPEEPWVSLAERYVAEGWQRPWPKWDDHWMRWAWDWLPSPALLGLDF